MESLETEYKFFWRSDPNPFSPISNVIWTPYDEGDCIYLERQYHHFLQNYDIEVFLGRPHKYQICFDNWLQINLEETWRQRPFRRELPSKIFNIARVDRFDADLLHSNMPKIEMIDKDFQIKKVLTAKEGYRENFSE